MLSVCLAQSDAEGCGCSHSFGASVCIPVGKDSWVCSNKSFLSRINWLLYLNAIVYMSLGGLKILRK